MFCDLIRVVFFWETTFVLIETSEIWEISHAEKWDNLWYNTFFVDWAQFDS